MTREEDELLTLDEACAYIGGRRKPINRATYYRGVAKGMYPAPVHPSPGISRVIKRQLAEARARVIGAGDDWLTNARIEGADA